MKKLVSAIFVALLVCFTSIGTLFVNASTITVAEMKDDLNQKGFSYEVLDTLEEALIEKYYYISLNNKFTTDTEQIYMDEGNESSIAPCGHIKDSMFSLTITRYQFYYGDSDQIYFNSIHVKYEWLKEPMIQKVDGIAINWDPNVLTYSANSFYAYDAVRHSLLIDQMFVKIHEYNNPNLAVQGGIGYSADFWFKKPAPSAAYVVEARYGIATFELFPTKNPIYKAFSSDPNSQVTSINVNYVHDRTPVIGSVSFSKAGFGVSINAPAINDSSSTTANVYYRN